MLRAAGLQLALLVAMLATRSGAEEEAAQQFSAEQLQEYFASVVEEGDLEEVERLIGEGVDVDERTNGWPLIVEAASEGHGAVVRALVESGAAVDAMDNNGWTALHLAAENGHAECVVALAGAGADVNAEDDSGKRPIHQAALGGSAPCIAALVHAGADADALNGDGFAPIHIAAMNGHATCIDALAQAGIGADLNAKDETHGTTALHMVAQNAVAVESVAALLRGGAQPNRLNRDGFRPLHAAATSGPEAGALCAVLVKGGAFADALSSASVGGATALHLAAYTDNVECVEGLAEAGANLEALDKAGFRPLHSAASAGHPNSVAALLRAGAKPENPARRAGGGTALELAKRGGHEEVVALLEGTAARAEL